MIQQADSPDLRALPPYPHWFAVADKLRVSVAELDTIDPYWIAVASVMLDAEHHYQERQRQKADAE